MTVQDGLVPVPKVRLDVINSLTEKQKAKRLILITTESGEVMWVDWSSFLYHFSLPYYALYKEK